MVFSSYSVAVVSHRTGACENLHRLGPILSLMVRGRRANCGLGSGGSGPASLAEALHQRYYIRRAPFLDPQRRTAVVDIDSLAAREHHRPPGRWTANHNSA